MFQVCRCINIAYTHNRCALMHMHATYTHVQNRILSGICKHSDVDGERAHDGKRLAHTPQVARITAIGSRDGRKDQWTLIFVSSLIQCKFSLNDKNKLGK